MGFHMPISTYLQTTIPFQVIRVLDYLQIFSETLLVIVIFCEDFGVGNHNQRRTIRLKLLCPQLWYPLVRQNPIGHGHREVLLFANPSILPVGMGRVTLDFVFLGIEYSEAGWHGIKRV
jgi:hypothetical protein